MIINRNFWFYTIQWICFAILLVLSFIFYRERLLADSGYYLMRMINSGSPWIEHQRYVLLLSQLLAWAGVMLHMPLKFILILYSLNHVLFPVLIFYLSVFYYRNPMAGIVLILLQTAGLTLGFFVPMFELYYAASLLVLVTAILYSGKNSPVDNTLLLGSVFFIISSHPVGLVLLIMTFSIYVVDSGWVRYKLFIIIGLFIAGFFIFKYFSVSEYESGKLKAITDGMISGKYNINWLTKTIIFSWKQYPVIIIVATGLLIQFIWNRKWIKSVVFVMFFVLVFLLSGLNSGHFVLSRYNEQVWFPLIFAAVYPLMTGVDFQFRKGIKTILFLIFLVFFSYRISLLNNESHRYRMRIKQLYSLVEYAKHIGQTRCVIDERNIFYNEIPDANWSFPIESMFLSAEKDPESTITLCTLEDYDFNGIYSRLNDSNYLFWRINPEPVSSLNPHYFHLNPGSYHFLNRKLSGPTDISSISGKVNIKVDKYPESVDSDILFPFSVRIFVHGEDTLYSDIRFGNHIKCRWEGPGGSVSHMIPLKVDISTKYEQLLYLKTPEVPGNYRLIISIMDAGENMLFRSKETEVKVK